MENNLDVFISYKSQNQGVADLLRRCLQGEGVSCWIASHDVKPGTDYAEEIVKAITSCKVLLLVLTKEANQDHRQIRRELSLADSVGKVIIPVRVDPIDPSPAFQYVLATCQVLDLYDEGASFSDTQASKVVRAVKYHLVQVVKNDKDQSIHSGFTTLPDAIAENVESSRIQPSNFDPQSHLTNKLPLNEKSDGSAISKALEEARLLRSNSGSKMKAAEVIFQALIGAKRSVVISALMKGAELSPAGASTYYQTLKSRFSGNKSV